jgi:chromosome partitioning protein
MAKKSLHRDLGGLAEGYDDVVIDTPGRSTDITRSAILASDLVIISVTPSPYDIWATEETVVLLEECREFKPDIRALFTINLKITNTLVADEAFQALQQVADYIIILKNQITRRVIFPRSASDGLSVQEVGDDKAAREIEDWYQEIRSVL